jgi:DNA-binding response OmpR family regulator
MAADAPKPLPIILAGHPTVRAVLADLLTDEGYEVVTAVDQATALALAESGPARLIILDLDVPRSDGVAFCRAYREHGGTAPIVLLTDDEIEPEMVARYGADGYLAKPFDLTVVLEMVERLTRPN